MDDRNPDYFRSDAVVNRDPVEHFDREHADAYQGLPPVNVLVAGPTGVGKSTLVNAVLRAPVAKTGRGTPVTDEITAWSVEGIPITVYDTPGLELDRKIKDTTKHVVKFVQKQLKADASEHPHILWYCINAQGNRFLDVEADFIKALSRLLPSIVVMTQCLGPEDEDAAGLRPSRPTAARRP